MLQAASCGSACIWNLQDAFPPWFEKITAHSYPPSTSSVFFLFLFCKAEVLNPGCTLKLSGWLFKMSGVRVSPQILIVRFGVWHKHQCFSKSLPHLPGGSNVPPGLESLQKDSTSFQSVYNQFLHKGWLFETVPVWDREECLNREASLQYKKTAATINSPENLSKYSNGDLENPYSSPIPQNTHHYQTQEYAV